jgi:CDP-glycerol glycerophosphotransferase
LGIPEGIKAVLYAPTKRDWLSHGDIKDQFSKAFDPFGLRDKLGPDYVILLRNHPLEGADFDHQKLGYRILKVSDYPSIQELFLASDIGVFDYSSLRFDYALTGKPMVFLVPDIDNYLSKRGSLFPYDDTAPGPWVKDTDDLAEQITHLGQVPSDYQRDRDSFVENYLPLEDGTAGERLIKLTVLANL